MVVVDTVTTAGGGGNGTRRETVRVATQFLGPARDAAGRAAPVIAGASPVTAEVWRAARVQRVHEAREKEQMNRERTGEDPLHGPVARLPHTLATIERTAGKASGGQRPLAPHPGEDVDSWVNPRPQR